MLSVLKRALGELIAELELEWLASAVLAASLCGVESPLPTVGVGLSFGLAAAQWADELAQVRSREQSAYPLHRALLIDLSAWCAEHVRVVFELAIRRALLGNLGRGVGQ